MEVTQKQHVKIVVGGTIIVNLVFTFKRGKQFSQKEATP